MISQYTPRFLTTAINEIKPPKRRLLDRLFPVRRESMAEYADIEIVTGRRNLARFVARGREAAVREKGGRKIVTFRIPSIREKMPFRAADVFKAVARGASPFVSSTAELKASLDKEVLFQLQEFRFSFDRTKEWLAAQAAKGSFTITLDDGDLTVDYGVPAANKPVLAGAAKWNSGSADLDILQQIRSWKRLISQGSGYTATDVTLGSNAADAFLADERVRKLLDANNLRVGTLDLTGDAEYIGTFAGLRFWTHEEQYTDASGNAQDYVPANVAIVSSNAPNAFWHGPVDDLEANFGTFEFFSKQFELKDPSTVMLLVATAPLPVIHHSSSLVYATVL
ncbi:MAG: major capsid protein [Ignavibacteriae bacterium]|nr:major capsid protein [Ignavibacteriota bacterium]